MPPKVLFIVPYPVKRAPSQRFRVELYERFMQEAGIEYRIAPFMDEHTWNILYKGGNVLSKAWGIVKGYLKRLKTVLVDAPSYDYIFIHREASPLGPPVFEWMLAKLLSKKLIYDFDDAIWIPNTTSENSLVSWFKAFWKVKHICKWSYKVAGGNEYLCSYARQYNNNVVLLPTNVDVENGHNAIKQHKANNIVIGWTGSHSTLFYLDELMPVIETLNRELKFTFAVIANRDPQLPLPNYQFIPWNESTEVTDLANFDIGVMPLTPDKWSEGKCGFKLIQYMALGIPAVASPVGVNKDIVNNGVNSYLASSPTEWHQHLTTLLKDAELRKKMGQSGRERIVNSYSIQAHRQTFLNLFS